MGEITKQELSTELYKDLKVELASTPADVEISGRTLVNLFGRAGNAIYKQEMWTKQDENISYVFEQDYISIDATIVDTWLWLAKDVKPNTYYISICEMNGSDELGAITVSSFSPSTYKENRVGINKFFALHTEDKTQLGIALTPNKIGNIKVKNVRLYEITEEEYNKINVDAEYIGDKLVEKYPYVDDIKCVVNPYVECNENLLERIRFERGKVVDLDTSSATFGEIVSTSNRRYSANEKIYLPHGKYSLKLPQVNISDLEIFVTEVNISKKTSNTLVAWGSPFNASYTFDFAEGYIAIAIRKKGETDFIDSEVGILNNTKLTLVKGDLSKSYEECHNSRVMFETRVYDSEKITRDNSGRYIKNSEWGEHSIEGQGKLEIYGDTNTYDSTCKTIAIRGIQGMFDSVSQYLVAYNGAIIKNAVNVTDGNYKYWTDHTSDILFITVPNSITGWGDTYTPTQEEIRAFFLGWRMFPSGENGFSKLYDGTNEKVWAKLWIGIGGKAESGLAPLVNGTDSFTCPTILNDQGYTPYKLIYKKETPTIEEVKTHGSLVVKEGVDVNVGSGLVLGEKIKAYFYSDLGNWYIHCSGQRLLHRTQGFEKIIDNHKSIVRFATRNVVNIIEGVSQAYTPTEPSNPLSVDYTINRAEVVTSFPYTVTSPQNTQEILERAIEELSNTNEKLSAENRELHNKIESLYQVSNPNLLINGDFQVWQRGEVIDTSGKAGRAYGADRWIATTTTSDVSKQGSIMKKGSNGMIMTRDINNKAFLRQRVERSILDKLVGKTITFSVKCKGENVLIQVYDRLNKYAPYSTAKFSYVDNEVVTLTMHNFNFNPNVTYLEFSICAETGSGDLEIEWAKLELGDKATPFVSRNYGEELALCQRYFESCKEGMAGSCSIARIVDGRRFLVPKRIAPTVTLYNQHGKVGGVSEWGDVNVPVLPALQLPTTIFGIPYIEVEEAVPSKVYQFGYEADAEIYA